VRRSSALLPAARDTLALKGSELAAARRFDTIAIASAAWAEMFVVEPPSGTLRPPAAGLKPRGRLPNSG